MPGMNFAFGIGNYFTFSFNLQLGPTSSTKDVPIQPRANIAHTSASIHSEAISNSTTSSITLAPSHVSVQQSQAEANPEAALNACLELAQNFLNQHPVDDPSDSLGAPVNTPPPVHGNSSRPPSNHTPTDIIASVPQTPPSTIPSVPSHAQRPRPQTRFRGLDDDHRYIRYLQTRTAGPRLRLPPMKLKSKQLPTPPTSDSSGTPTKKALSFQTLPSEIRSMIYDELLVSAQCIKKPHKLVCNKKSIMLDSIKPIKDIDSAILRVCRSIYYEALPVLYGNNTFEFCKPRKLRDFSHAGLDRRLTKFGLREAETGRFTLIRSIILRLGHDRKPYIWQHHATQAPDRKKLWSHWYQYFFNEGDNRSEYDWSIIPCLSHNFPALDRLVLDFTDWQLGDQDAIRVDPFIAKFGRSGGLSSVDIKGVQNATNLEDFRTGLVKPGGTFTVKS
ncbi:MAG: hypothetical protein Q9218_002652 [Villophora microphyllina]